MIGKKFSEYFSCQLAQDFVDYGLFQIDKKQFKVDHASLHEIIFFAECLICGGRSIFGLTCKKCNERVYNIGIGFCAEYKSSGPLLTFCQTCRKGRYQNFPIECVNICHSTVFKCINPKLDRVWYNNVQRSFLQGVRDNNIIHRYSSEVEMRRISNFKRAEDP